MSRATDKRALCTYGEHRLGPLSVASLEQFDAVDVVADLDQVSHYKLGSASLRPGCCVAAAHHVGLRQDGRVERPPEGTRMNAFSYLDLFYSQFIKYDTWARTEYNRSEPLHRGPHLFPLGYWTTMS